MDAEKLARKMAVLAIVSPRERAWQTLIPYTRALIKAEEALAAADSIMWMASEYADAGGSNGPEMREYRPAAAEVTAALAAIRSLLEK